MFTEDELSDMPLSMKELLSDIATVLPKEDNNSNTAAKGKILIIGGKAVQTALEPEDKGWCCTLQSIYGTKYDLITWLGGAITSQINPQDYSQNNIKLTIIHTGLDEALESTPFPTYCMELERVVKGMRRLGSKVIVIPTPPVNLDHEDYLNQAIMAIGSAGKGVVDVVRQDDEGVRFINIFNVFWTSRYGKDLITDTGVPSPQGNDLIVECVIEEVKGFVDGEELLPAGRISKAERQPPRHQAPLAELAAPDAAPLSKVVWGDIDINDDIDSIIAGVAHRLDMASPWEQTTQRAKTCPACHVELTVVNGDRLPFCPISGTLHDVPKHVFPSEKLICSDCKKDISSSPYCMATGRLHKDPLQPRTLNHPARLPVKRPVRDKDPSRSERDAKIQEITKAALLDGPINPAPAELTSARSTAKQPAWSSSNMPISRSKIDPLTSLPAILMDPAADLRRRTL
eukprot:TRINITY_DN3120_c0_g1_i1.p1 TRINITY_DN3120_c0_g1~~TRINITY_DN3120_c0_g1_i1.p1  ORF type:complete len:458 (+),score=79.39 TRINITY_DN3120_c0_g1_i1:61-1434(+)